MKYLVLSILLFMTSGGRVFAQENPQSVEEALVYDVRVGCSMKRVQLVVDTNNNRIHLENKGGRINGTGKTVIHLVKLSNSVPAPKLDEELAKLGYKFVDPIALIALHKKKSFLRRGHPCITQWKDKDGELCFATFIGRDKTNMRRYLKRTLYEIDWVRSNWYLACVPVDK